MPLSTIHGIRQVRPGTLNTYTRTNSEVVDIPSGSPVTLYSTSGCKLAQAKSVLTMTYGLAYKLSPTGSSVLVVTSGVVSKSDWTLVAGAASLTPNATYYLSVTTPGYITSTSPSGVGEVYQPVGYALSTTDFIVQIQPFVLL